MNDDRQTTARFHEEMEALFEKKPFLFDHGNPFIPLPDYFRYFGWRSEVMFSQYACPWGYGIDILDQFKGKIAWASSVATPDGARTFMIVVQDGPDFHIVATVGFSRDNDCLALTFELLAIDMKKIGEFITKNKSHRLVIRKNNVGLSHLPS